MNPANDTARIQRRRRAAIAQRLLARSPDAVASVEWDVLDRAPGWLALPDAELALAQRQIGAVVYAREMRLWIDGARLAATRAAVGDAYLNALLAQRDVPMPPGLLALPRIDNASQVATRLQSAGAALLLASLAPGPLRTAAGALFAPVVAAPIAPELAHSLIARARALAAQGLKQ